jgi:hypothetical protein
MMQLTHLLPRTGTGLGGALKGSRIVPIEIRPASQAMVISIGFRLRFRPH